MAAAAAAGPGPEEDEELKEEFEEYEEGEYEEGEEYEEYEEGEEGAAEGVPAALPPAAASGDSAPAQQQQQRGSGEADEGEYEEGEYEEGGKGEGEGEGEVVIGAGGYPEPPQHHMFLSDVMHMTGEDLLAAYVLAQREFLNGVWGFQGWGRMGAEECGKRAVAAKDVTAATSSRVASGWRPSP